MTGHPSRMPSHSTILANGALVLLALTSLNSKIAGALWGLAFIVAAVLAWRGRPWPLPDPIDRAALIWVAAAAGSFACWVAVAALWGELYPLQSAEVNAGARLTIGALAGWWLVRVGLTPETRAADRITIATAIACLVALGVSLSAPDHEHFPSNVIPWSASIGFLACVLVARAFDRRASPGIRWIGALGVVAALLPVIGTQRRGIYPVILWVLVVALVNWYRRTADRRRFAAAALVATAALGFGLGVAALQPADPLRLRETVNDLRVARESKDFNTATGARVYLFELGWRTFVESPWIGVGARERLARIRQSGADEAEERTPSLRHVRDLGHVHNAYLHHAMDGGIIGLTGFLVSVVGLLLLAHRLHPLDPVASLQAYGIAFVHAVTNLTNVNLAHNYYALMLAISIALVVVQARLLGPERAH